MELCRTCVTRGELLHPDEPASKARSPVTFAMCSALIISGRCIGMRQTRREVFLGSFGPRRLPLTNSHSALSILTVLQQSKYIRASSFGWSGDGGKPFGMHLRILCSSIQSPGVNSTNNSLPHALRSSLDPTHLNLRIRLIRVS